MGKSSSFRGGPGWQERNTPGGTTKVSKGAVVKPEGSYMSDGGSGRKGPRKGTRSKSRSGMASTRPKTVYG